MIVIRKEVSRVKHSSVKIPLFESYENGIIKSTGKNSIILDRTYGFLQQYLDHILCIYLLLSLDGLSSFVRQ